MQKIISGSEVKILDARHVEKHGISSWEMMEKAAMGFMKWFLEENFPRELKISVFCGPGNNGGDGLGIARLLFNAGYLPSIFLCFEEGAKLSVDCKRNFEILPAGFPVYSWKEFQRNDFDLVIDGFLGVGVKGDLRSEAQEVIRTINQFRGKILSIDLPSGLCADSPCVWECVKATTTLTFAFPKLSLLLPEIAQYSGELVLIPIGIEENEFDFFESNRFYLQSSDVPFFHKDFTRFAHKGDFGKILLIAGSAGKMGAGILSSKSALRTGSGLVNVQVPWEERVIIQTSVPEAMIHQEGSLTYSNFDAIGIGPGMGIDQVGLLKNVLESYSKPMVLDADALTILSRNSDLIPVIPKNSILTPHLGEFDRIFGKSTSQLERMEKAKEFCLKNQLNLLIKGANSIICLADGRQIFNSSGTKYMATAGSGDVLTGMLTSFLGQGYTPEQALICGVFQHGLAGEIASKSKVRSTIASDIIEAIPDTFISLGVS